MTRSPHRASDVRESGRGGTGEHDSSLRSAGCRGGRRRSPQAALPRPKAADRPSRWTAGRITALVIGALLVLLSLALLGAGGTALWADRTQRDGGYVTTDVHDVLHLRLGTGDRVDRARIGGGRLALLSEACSTRFGSGSRRRAPARRCSWGSAPPRTSIATSPGSTTPSSPSSGETKTETVAGGAPRSAPGTQNFWVASDTGRGARTLVWDPDRRIVDGRGDECRRATRDRRGRGPGSPNAGRAVDRRRRARRRGGSSWPAGRS